MCSQVADGGEESDEEETDNIEEFDSDDEGRKGHK